ncbi:MAG TPA: Do family serine endopeptidase [bacterium]|nr:Do family serine endopeptidase [bacterium]
MKRLFIPVLFFLVFAVSACGQQIKMVPATFSGVAQKVQGAVVNISTVTVVQQRGMRSPFRDPFFDDDFFNRFFGVPQGTFRSRSLGSGVLVDSSGHIMTNAHVVDRADEITVKLYNGKEYKAKVIGADRETDVAVIKIEGSGFSYAKLGDSNAIDVGDWVIAVGSPFGLEQTVTQGIISAKGRIIGAGPYDDFLQTDAAINPGNSGGPLVNLNGEVIGINTAITSRSGGYEGVGFAIPINMAKKIYNDIVKQGKVVRGWLGVAIQDLTPELKAHFKVEGGVLMSQVFEGGPAAKGGMKRGDVIIQFDGKKVDKYRDLQAMVAETPVNKKVRVRVMRDGKPVNLDIAIGERGASSELELPKVTKSEGELGLLVGAISPEAASRFGTSAKQGVIVLGVTPGSAPEDAGIMRGDVIHELNGRQIKNMADYEAAVKATVKKGRQSVFLIERGDAMVYMAFMVR